MKQTLGPAASLCAQFGSSSFRVVQACYSKLMVVVGNGEISRLVVL